MHPGLKSWRNLVSYAYNAFSIPLLLRTLFAPWERDRGEGAGFDTFEKILFTIFSRVLGFGARLLFIALGLVFTFLAILSFPIFFFIPIKLSKEFFNNLGSFGAFLSYGNTFTLNKHSKDTIRPSSLRVIGKEKALRMIERGLTKENNHNVLLVGNTGVGKSFLISHMGRMAQSGFAFESIRHHRLLDINLENMTVDDFEASMSEARDAGNIVVVLENIDAYPNLFERLMHYLNEPELAIIATTDYGGYDGVLKNHPDFLSKFAKVEVLPASAKDTLEILRNHASLNKVYFKKGALEELVRLSDKLIHNEFEPLKSLLVLEELKTLDKKITIDDVRQIISDKTNMPLGSMSQDEREVLTGLEEIMRSKIVGQDEAVEEVAEALRRLRAGVADPDKPAGSFLFLGPTGVGKTYTSKILAESYFGRKDAMIRFDMSEFALPGTVPVFLDRLASVIEDNPLSLVFFDELEKANRTIHNLLLQVLDEGKLTRDNGRVAYFRDSIIIATSNAGSAEIMENPSIDKKVLIDGLIQAGIFAPEFLNRFSGIVLFGPLDQDEIKQVAKLMLEEFKERLLSDKGITLDITEALVEEVAKAGFDPDFGARPIRRAIEDIVENKVADYLIQGGEGGTLKIM